MQQMADSVDDAAELKQRVKECKNCEAVIRQDERTKLQAQGWKSREEIGLMFNPDYLDFQKGVEAERELTATRIEQARQDERRKLGEWLTAHYERKLNGEFCGFPTDSWASIIKRLKSGDSPEE